VTVSIRAGMHAVSCVDSWLVSCIPVHKLGNVKFVAAINKHEGLVLSENKFWNSKKR
jgi:hypothetical protein